MRIVQAYDYEISFLLLSLDEKITSEQLKHDTKNWLLKFISLVINPDNAVKPHMHIFCKPFVSTSRIFNKKRTVNQFAFHARAWKAERFHNEFYFQRCSNKKGEIMLQILGKITRIELLTYFMYAIFQSGRQ